MSKDFASFERQVGILLKKRYGITLKDVQEDFIIDAFEDGLDAVQTVKEWGNIMDLIEIPGRLYV